MLDTFCDTCVTVTEDDEDDTERQPDLPRGDFLMPHIADNQHFWTYLPELGPDWEYCGRCKKARRVGETQRMSYTQALSTAEAQALAKKEADEEA